MKLKYSDLKGLEYDPCLTRRDPSPVINIDGTYYIYYSKTLSIGGWDASIWCASSPDGVTWKEECEVISKGPIGAFDSGGVFTPTTLICDGTIYLFYTAVASDFQGDSIGENGKDAIGLVKSLSPIGPFERVGTAPVLKTGTESEFDSHRVDDTCLIRHDGRYYMYYKGRQVGKTAKETKMGLAIADYPEGPYQKYEGNPVLKSGHEVCVYPTRGGFMALVTDVGPEGNTYQYSKDGKKFCVTGELFVPGSVGPYREDAYENNKDFELHWGVCHQFIGKRPYLKRFDVID